MAYYFVAPVVILSVACLLIGTLKERPWALYLLDLSWLFYLAVAIDITLDVWKGRSYSEHWEMIGVLFFVWPITGFVVVLAVAEILLLRGKTGPHIRVLRVLAVVIPALLTALSVAALIIGG